MGTENQSKLLIVDDTPANLELLQNILSQEDYQIRALPNGSMALNAARKEVPDLILLDIKMPGMDGYEVCAQLKADIHTRDVPIIFISALQEAEDKVKAFTVGGVDYISKPFQSAEVLARVQTHLKLKKMHEQLQRQNQELESELDIAGQIQRDMVPRVELLHQAGRPYELSALLQPARQVGGDFYDFFLLENQRLCLIIGDVAGKGVPAALLMARTVTLIRASARQFDNPIGILAAVNRELCHNNEECRFVTLFCGVLDLPSGQLDYASSGHDPPLLLRGPVVCFLDLETGPPLGLDETAVFLSYRQHLERNDLLLLYTDGLTEAMNPRQEIFSESRLQQLLSAQTTGNPARLIRTLQYHLKQFVEDAPSSDDLTLLALQYLPSCPFPLETRTLEWKIRLNSELTEIARVKERLGTLLQTERLAVESIEDALLIVEEVIANIVRHGKGIGPEDFIDLRVSIVDTQLRLCFEDRAAPFDPINSIPAADLSMDDDERALGGLGFFLVQELAERLDYAYQDGKNILTVEQRVQYCS